MAVHLHRLSSRWMAPLATALFAILLATGFPGAALADDDVAAQAESSAKQLEALASETDDPELKKKLLQGAEDVRTAAEFVRAVDKMEEVRPVMELYARVFTLGMDHHRGADWLSDEKFIANGDAVRALMARMDARLEDPDEEASEDEIVGETLDAIELLAGK